MSAQSSTTKITTNISVKNLVALLILFLVLLSANLTQASTAHAAAPTPVSIASVTIIHYENGKPVGTHIVSDAWYAFAIRSGYLGERLDELYHFCANPENKNDPKCRHML
jgi:hypothetical protein